MRNLDWWGQVWHQPEQTAWGDQVQDGGAVLGLSFFDLWARLHVLGPDDAWKRLQEILDWQERVWAQGVYRDYYSGTARGRLQGCGTPGGLGIDCEFFESSLLPSIMIWFLTLSLHRDSRDVPQSSTNGVLGCPECRGKMRVPTGYQRLKVTCPHCGRIIFAKT